MKKIAQQGPLRSRSLPVKHLAIFFQGTWLLTKDPDDPNRILAACPYVDEPDHICEVGLWNETKASIVSPQGASSLLMEEGDYLRVDVTTNPRVAPPSLKDLFNQAAGEFNLPLVKPSAGALKLSVTRQMRTVSVSLPSVIYAAGKSDAVVRAAKNANKKIAASFAGEISSYVNIILVYTFKKSAAMSLGNGFMQQQILKSSDKRKHLLFRVHMDDPSKVNRPKGQRCDDRSEEIVHITHSFNMLRKMIFVDGPNGVGDSKSFPDIALYPRQCDYPQFENDFMDISDEELGTKTRMHIRTLASCATGPILGDDGP